MKRSQKALNLFLAVTLAVPGAVVLPNVSSAASGSDLSKHWAKDQIGIWTALDLATGYPDGTFKPDNKVTRAEFMALVNRVFDYTAKAEVNFKDVTASDWYYEDVAKAVAAGYIDGYKDGTIKPLETISRQEAAVIISRIKKLPTTSSSATFTDAAQIASWSKDAIQSVVSAGYMNGYPGQLFKPSGLVTRAEAVVSLDRAGDVSAQTTVFSKAGLVSDQKLEGNVIIAASGVELKNFQVSGNLVITEEVGEGDVDLSKSAVKGKTVVKGGGAHSVHLTDSLIAQLKVVKPNVRILAQGSTSVEQTEVLAPAKLEEGTLSADGFNDVSISTSENVQLVGAFKKIQLTEKAKLELIEGVIGTLIVPLSGQGSEVALGAGTGVDSATIDGAAQISGPGKIKQATINVNGVTIATKPDSITIGEGVTATIGDQQVNQSSTGGGSTGGNNSTPGNGSNPGGNPGNAPGETPGNNPGNAPGETPGNNPGDTPGETPGNNPGDTPGETPGNNPGNAPGETPGNNPGDAPGETPPGNDPGDAPGETPPGNDPGDAPGETPGNDPGDAPGETPGNDPGDAPGETPPGNDPGDAPGEGEQATTAPSAAQITVVNNSIGTADTVTVDGLSAGDIVKVYDSAVGGSAIGTGTVGTDQTSLIISISQLGTEAGTVFVSVTSSGKLESTRTSKAFIAEPVLTPEADAKAVADAKAALILNYAGMENSITLPANGIEGTSVTWALKDSSQANIVDISTGAINHYGIDSDTDVILVATITRGTVTDTKEITISVTKMQVVFVVNQPTANSAAVTGIAKPGATVTVRTGELAMGNANADLTGAFSVPIPNQPEGTVLEVIASDNTGYTSNAIYVLVLKAGTMTDRESVDGAAAAITENSIKQSNTSLSDVKTSLNLPIAGLNGTSIVWTSDRSSVVSSNGSVKRPVMDEPDAAVTLTATISKNGVQSIKTFQIIVKAQTELLTVVSFDDIVDSVKKGAAYSLPAQAMANMSDGTKQQFDVLWSSSTVDTSVAGTYNFTGTVQGYTAAVKLTLIVTAQTALTVAQALAAVDKTTVVVEGYVQDIEGNPDSAGYGIYLADTAGKNNSATAIIVKLKKDDRNGPFSKQNAANRKVIISGPISNAAYFSKKGFADTYTSIEFADGGTTPALPAPNAAPAASNVQVNGTIEVGQTLTGAYTYADAENDAEGASLFQWYQVNGSTDTIIPGATGPSYVVQQSDVGKALKFEVIPVASSGTTTGTAFRSTASAIVPAVQIPETPISSLTSTSHTASTASFSFTAPAGATAVSLYYSLDAGATWVKAYTDAALSAASQSATAINLTADTTYMFKLEVTGGSFAGSSNTVTVKTDAAPVVPSVLIDEGFDKGTQAPEGWTFNGKLGTYSSDGNYGKSSPSIQLNATGQYIQTSLLSAPATELSVWLKGNGTNASSSLLIQGLINGNWVTVTTINPLPTDATGKTLTFSVDNSTLPTGITQVRFTYTKGAGNLALDDVTIKG